MWLKLTDPIDKLIDGISMYRLLMYYLIALIVVAFGFSAVNIMHYNALYIAFSAIILVFACWVINKVLASIFNAPVNPESAILTGLILALIVPPSPTGFSLLFLIAVAGLAMASKYILTIKKKHIFNPAAIAVVLTALGPKQSASWWVGTAAMLPFVLIGGILIVRKVRRGEMVLTFLITTTLATVLLPVSGGGHLISNLENMVLNSSVFFLGFVMLTEPYTSPTTRNKQLWYAAIVGIILAPQFHIGSYYSTPEIALIVGNVFAYLSGSKVKLFPVLFRKQKIASDSAEFAFAMEQPLDYLPGQYMEFTLPHTKIDDRGARRYFTLSSSPTEDHLKIGVKFYDDGSTYKSALLDIDQNSRIVASQLAGDFILPKDTNKKLVFVAGGIGITPYRSMLKYLVDTKEKRDIILLYSARTEEEIAYRDIFDEAKQALGIEIIYVISGRGASITDPNAVAGNVNSRLIKTYITDFHERTFYISGTHEMVESLQETLSRIGIRHANIKVDFFPGYA
jgi:ferredoxin-NADP reductase/Na+-translocating ferredoxin:NAD+ oxidoreductase RnfD subunit